MKSFVVILCAILTSSCLCSAYNTCTIDGYGVFDDGFDVDGLNVYGTADMTGGRVRNAIQLYGTINIYGGTVGDSLICWDGGRANIYNIDQINTAYGFSIIAHHASGLINIYGGAGTGGFINQLDIGGTSYANIYGFDLIKISTGGYYGCGTVSGRWKSGQSFVFNNYYSCDLSRINLIEIPEPATLLLLGLGGLVMRKCRR